MPSTPAPSRAAVRYILVTVLLEVLALGMVAPALPKLVEAFLGGDTARAAVVFGAMAMVWAVMQLIFSPLLGALSDRFGRRPVILLSHAGAGLDYLAMAFAPGLIWLFAGRAVAGILAATFSTSAAYIADVTPPERRAAEVGRIGAVFGLGFIIAPAIGGLLAALDLRLPFLAAAVLSLLSAIYGYFILPESLPRERRRPLELASANPISTLSIYGTQPGLAALGAIVAINHIAHSAWPTVGVLYVGHRYGWGPYETGVLMAVFGLVGALTQGLMIGPIVSRIGARAALLAGLASGVACFAIQGAAATPVVLFLSLPFSGLWGLVGPAAFQLLSARIPADRQGALQGADATLIGFGNLTGPLLFSQSLALAVPLGAASALTGLPMFLAAGLLGIGLWILVSRAWR
jgi:DHA1 family tetracycline resistance protein-like MFS transporter